MVLGPSYFCGDELMTRIAAVMLGAFVFVNQASAANRERLIIRTQDGDMVRLSFDPSRISRVTLRSLIRFSPWGESNVTPSLSQCVDRQSQYRQCGNRTLGSENFLYNAAVNLREAEKQLASFDTIEVPAELSEVAAFMKRQKAFWICLDRAELAYYRGNDRALLTRCDVVDSNTECRDATNAALNALTPAAREDVAHYKWYNCMNEAFYHPFPSPPNQQQAFAKIWKTFLKAYGIREEFIPSGEDRNG